MSTLARGQVTIVDLNDGVIYQLAPSTSYLTIDKSSNYSESIVTCSVNKIIGGTTSKDNNYGTLSYVKDNGTELPYTRESNLTLTSLKPTSSIKFILKNNNGVIVDTLTIPVIKEAIDGEDGKNAVTVFLSNQVDSIPTNTSNGTIGTNTLSTEIYVLDGSTRVTSGISFGTIPSILGKSCTRNGNICTWSNIAANTTFENSIEAKIPITYKEVTYNLTFTVTPSKQGTPGNTGTSVKEVVFLYKISVESVSKPTSDSGWTTIIPTYDNTFPTNGKYYIVSKTIYDNNDVVYSDPKEANWILEELKNAYEANQFMSDVKNAANEAESAQAFADYMVKAFESGKDKFVKNTEVGKNSIITGLIQADAGAIGTLIADYIKTNYIKSTTVDADKLFINGLDITNIINKATSNLSVKTLALEGGTIGGWEIDSSSIKKSINSRVNHFCERKISELSSGNLIFYTEYWSAAQDDGIWLPPDPTEEIKYRPSSFKICSEGIGLGSDTIDNPYNYEITEFNNYITSDGLGELANGNLSWTADGVLNIGKYVKDGITKYYTTIGNDGVLNTSNIIATGGKISSWNIDANRMYTTKLVSSEYTEGTNENYYKVTYNETELRDGELTISQYWLPFIDEEHTSLLSGGLKIYNSKIILNESGIIIGQRENPYGYHGLGNISTYFNSDGSGKLANGNLTWDTEGKLTAGGWIFENDTIYKYNSTAFDTTNTDFVDGTKISKDKIVIGDHKNPNVDYTTSITQGGITIIQSNIGNLENNSYTSIHADGIYSNDVVEIKSDGTGQLNSNISWTNNSLILAGVNVNSELANYTAFKNSCNYTIINNLHQYTVVGEDSYSCNCNIIHPDIYNNYLLGDFSFIRIHCIDYVDHFYKDIYFCISDFSKIGVYTYKASKEDINITIKLSYNFDSDNIEPPTVNTSVKIDGTLDVDDELELYIYFKNGTSINTFWSI